MASAVDHAGLHEYTRREGPDRSEDAGIVGFLASGYGSALQTSSLSAASASRRPTENAFKQFAISF